MNRIAIACILSFLGISNLECSSLSAASETLLKVKKGEDIDFRGLPYDDTFDGYVPPLPL